mgnify:CR=1 FL=1
MRVLFAVVLAAVTGCATVMAGGPDRFPVTTNPPGATVYVDNIPIGQTPTMVTLDRERSGGVIRIELAGYAPVAIVRAKTVNGWFWANICWGFWPAVIDFVTGNFKAFENGPIAIGLSPEGGAPPPGYQPPPPGYQPPPPGYQPPPAGYQPPPAGYQPPPAAPPRR